MPLNEREKDLAKQWAAKAKCAWCASRLVYKGMGARPKFCDIRCRSRHKAHELRRHPELNRAEIARIYAVARWEAKGGL